MISEPSLSDSLFDSVDLFRQPALKPKPFTSVGVIFSLVLTILIGIYFIIIVITNEVEVITTVSQVAGIATGFRVNCTSPNGAVVKCLMGTAPFPINNNGYGCQPINSNYINQVGNTSFQAPAVLMTSGTANNYQDLIYSSNQNILRPDVLPSQDNSVYLFFLAQIDTTSLTPTEIDSLSSGVSINDFTNLDIYIQTYATRSTDSSLYDSLIGGSGNQQSFYQLSQPYVLRGSPAYTSTNVLSLSKFTSLYRNEPNYIWSSKTSINTDTIGRFWSYCSENTPTIQTLFNCSTAVNPTPYKCFVTYLQFGSILTDTRTELQYTVLQLLSQAGGNGGLLLAILGVIFSVIYHYRNRNLKPNIQPVAELVPQ